MRKISFHHLKRVESMIKTTEAVASFLHSLVLIKKTIWQKSYGKFEQFKENIFKLIYFD